MELTQIRYFIAVEELGNFTRAADRCEVSQPALTKGIKRLEEQLGGPLFHREGKRLIRTALGDAIGPVLHELWSQAEAVERAVENYRLLDRVPLKVGMQSSIGPLRLSALLADFKHSYSGVDLEIHQGTLESTADRLDEGELDLAVISGAPAVLDRFHNETIYTESYGVAFAPGHRFERFTEVKLEDVQGEPYVDRLACELREQVTALCEANKIDLYAAFRSEREDWVQAMVAAGIGFAFLPEYSVANAGILMRPLTEPRVEREIKIARPYGRQLSGAARGFWTMLTHGH